MRSVPPPFRRSAAMLLSIFVAVTASAAGPTGSAPEPLGPIDSVDPYVAVPGAAKLASSKRIYRVVFDARRGAATPGDLVPAVNMAGSEINTLAAHRVPRRGAQFAIVFHTASANDALLADAHYRAKFGIANPNLAPLAALRAAGVELYVCGQQLLADGIPLAAVSPDITVVEDGLVTIIELQNDGYAYLPF